MASDFDHKLFATELAGMIKEKLDQELAPLRRQLDQLAAREKSFSYRGVWKDGEQYFQGNFVTQDGSLWACSRETRGKPGDSDAWTLACKRGRDGKDVGRAMA
jgi:hypothetical protein